jgi:hypothetical protein
MKGGGPIGEFLYEVGEMKGDLQMGNGLWMKWRVHATAEVQLDHRTMERESGSRWER